MVWLLCLTPLALLVYAGFNDGLGANPVEFITRYTGKYALIFLCITLTITPFRKITNLSSFLRFRRILGLFTFFYALIHFTIWFWLDHSLDLNEMLKDVYKRPFITVGFAGFLLLICLAATSFNKAIKLMGKNWQKLHYSIYVIAGLALLHYYWIKSSKNNFSDFYIYAGILAILAAYRIVAYLKKK